jgi:hypothetical protein
MEITQDKLPEFDQLREIREGWLGMTQERFERILSGLLGRTFPKLLENDEWKETMWRRFCEFMGATATGAQAEKFVSTFKDLVESLVSSPGELGKLR